MAASIPALIERGHYDAAEETLARLNLPDELPASMAAAGSHILRAQLHYERGRLAEAAAEFTRLQKLYEREGPMPGPQPLPAKGLCAALAAVGRREEARAIAADAVEKARTWGTPVWLGAALRSQALVEEGDARIELLEAAVQVLEPTIAALERSRTLLELGAAHRRARRRREAREPLRTALELAMPGGALALAERARTELAASGEHVRKSALETGAAALTASERRVAEHAIDGLSNREIAQTLYVTKKTVETQLSSCFRKLGVSGRHELAEALSD